MVLAPQRSRFTSSWRRIHRKGKAGMKMIAVLFLPPAKEVCEAYVCTGMCPGGGVLCPEGLCLGVSVRGRSPSRGSLCQGDPPVRLRVGSTHPTGIHSCSLIFIVFCFKFDTINKLSSYFCNTTLMFLSVSVKTFINIHTKRKANVKMITVLFLPIVREGNVFTDVCHSVHNRPHDYSVTAHPCYSHRW